MERVSGLALSAALFSALAAIGGLWSGYEAIASPNLPFEDWL